MNHKISNEAPMKNLTLNFDRVLSFISEEEIKGAKERMEKHNIALHEKSGKGNDFLGWINLPSSVSEAECSDFEKTADLMRSKKIEILIVVGIGGSYLGTKAVADALSDSFAHLKPIKNPLIIFAGHNISEDYHSELRELLKVREYAMLVISKSGTTTEPAMAFRLLKKDLEEKYGKEEAGERIIAITDESKGVLRHHQE